LEHDHRQFENDYTLSALARQFHTVGLTRRGRPTCRQRREIRLKFRMENMCPANALARSADILSPVPARGGSLSRRHGTVCPCPGSRQHVGAPLPFKFHPLQAHLVFFPPGLHLLKASAFHGKPLVLFSETTLPFLIPFPAD
jgi:hypothetical protein